MPARLARQSSSHSAHVRTPLEGSRYFDWSLWRASPGAREPGNLEKKLGTLAAEASKD